ncbi:MAG: pyridoxal phosphate-dependent aminotransferase [Gemmiger sp.]|nr:pyridoxal phosphate-dependent aminotransferase [Gemmiger sp.]
MENSPPTPFDFDTIIPRRGTACSKWDAMPYPGTPPGTIPMWVADMDFACPPAVMDALAKRLQHPVFGYAELPPDYGATICSWQRQRYGAAVTPQDIVPVASVMGGVAMALQALTQPGDAVLVPTPGYHAFGNAIHQNARRLVCCPLRHTGGQYTLDLARMEQQMVAEDIRLVVFCSPHNPTGRLWTRQELEGLVNLCARHHIPLLSDEIHADMTLGKKFTTIFSAGAAAEEIAIALYAPTKTFNMAGLCTAFAVIKNPALQQKFSHALLASGLKVKNTLGVAAMLGGYRQGGGWVDELQAYLLANLRYAVAYLTKHTPTLRAYLPEATYFLWIDFGGTGLTAAQIKQQCVYEAGVAISCGTEFIQGGDSFVRMNCACPRALLHQALVRLGNVFENGKTV